jgi:hypothetical protein
VVLVLRGGVVLEMSLDLVVLVRDRIRLFPAPMPEMTLDLLGVLVLRKIPLVLHACLQWKVESLVTRRWIVKNLP